MQIYGGDTLKLTLDEARLLCHLLETSYAQLNLPSKDRQTLNRLRLKADLERRDLAKNAKTETVIKSL